MSVRNRELSQFGSFIYIDDTTKTVGITTEETPYVGIGTTNASHKLTVVGTTNITGNTSIGGNTNITGSTNIGGDTNVSGILSATSYYLNGNPLVSAANQSWDLVGSDVYRLNGNVGIGTSIITERLEVDGNVKASQFISTVTTGASPFNVSSQTLVTNLNADYLRGKTPPSGDIVGTTDAQILSNKTFALPTFGGTGVAFTGSTSGITTLRSSPVSSGVIVLPAVTGIATAIVTGSVGLVTSGMIADLSIVDADVSSSAAISYGKLSLNNSITNSDISSSASIAISKLAASTISGISLGGSLNNLTAGSFINYSSGSTYNGSSAVTVSVAGTTTNTANTLVARNNSGDFSAGTISCANLTATFTITAADFNSVSDENLKTNIQTVQNSLDTVKQLRGVNFDWKNTGNPSTGVIAQELEKVLPQLVNEGDHKSVNYNGLIGILIEAVKELSEEIEELKRKNP